ncbi:carboxypeptidase-like regulatory domain-containing protein [Mucilaginibacter sp. SMC90]|uniref:TonB-dependent receptor n=1 Tax=Mucilaginibacter sp. SMC90 TaxID=2929803 RepID=UPI001FB2962A|nr:carboxypeptidase-like regulatory domain-containing protein [Mucilaginibacter sp. SMC90]UOE49233.1 carboxypeptidase-like regulatory domain-containing protein [Mucilaginibacter sp. SMC90]
MSRFIKHIRLLGIALLFSASGFSQSIKGIVKDSTGKPVPYATINLRNIAAGSIVTYTITDTRGSYILLLPANVPVSGLAVEVRCIGYKNQQKNITDFQAPVDFTLTASVNQLQAVVIKSSRPVLRTNGDTLSYKVSDFSSAQDRVIGDVIKKLPGITVAADGRISYNNKPISNLYIGGDNLLDDKYNIATGTIPNGVVDQVQVIQNHQPVKVLQNKVMSDDVALNLSIKKGAKLQMVGQESIGAGLPGNYDADMNAMMFKDKYKAINYLKGNNTGNDLQEDLVSHNYADYMQRIDNDVPATVLSLGSVNDPALSRNRYLFNKAGILNLNNLVNFKKNVQMKINAYYLHDTQRQDYSQQTTIFLPGDTVRYSETQRNRFSPDVLHAQFTLNVNQDKYYLNNVLLLDNSRSVNYSALNANGGMVNQVFRDNALSFSNEFNLIRSLKSNNIIQAYCYISHSTEPESRAIEPNFNNAIFNNGIPYARLAQNVNVPAWYTNNYISFKIPSNFITQSFRTGFSLQSQNLTSNLNAVQNDDTVKPQSDSSVNHLNWTRKKLYAEAAYDLPGDILKVNLTLPISLQQINYSDSLYSLSKSLTRLYINPQLRVKYKTGQENYLNFLYSYRNETGTIEDMYQGYILKDYRTLYANNAGLTERQNQQAAIGFNYRKALTLFFGSLNVVYNHVASNNIASEVITNSLRQRVVLPYSNSTDSWTMNATVSKYSFSLKTTFSGGLQWQSNKSVQIQNNTLLPFNTVSKSINTGADTKVNELVNFSYKAILTQTHSHSATEASAYHISQLLQQASVNYNPVTVLQFRLSGEHYFTRQQGNPDLKYFFADASAKFRVEKWKIDLELSAANFLNVKTYNTLYLSANTLTASSYTLPGRIILLKVQFHI